jgi:hypothetical protein
MHIDAHVPIYGTRKIMSRLPLCVQGVLNVAAISANLMIGEWLRA